MTLDVMIAELTALRDAIGGETLCSVESTARTTATEIKVTSPLLEIVVIPGSRIGDRVVRFVGRE